MPMKRRSLQSPYSRRPVASALGRLTRGVSLALLLTTPALVTAQNADADGDAEIAAANAMQQSGSGRTLEDFFLSAMDHSPRLRVAEARRDIGDARRRGATGQLLPQVSASASITENRQERADPQTGTEEVSRYQGERYAVQLRQVLFDWQTFQRRNYASLEEAQFDAEYFAELSALLTEVAEAYFDVLQAEDALASSESELEATRNQLDQIQRMHGMQMVQITDLRDAEARLAQVEAEQVYLSSDVELAREALYSISGLVVGDLFTLGDDTELPEVEGTIQDWVTLARQGNHLVQAREYAVQAAGRRVAVQRGAYMPRVSLIAQQQQSNLGFDNRLDQRTDTGYIGLDVTIPLFAGGSSRAAVSEARSQENIARNELRQLNLDVNEQTRLAYLRLQTTQRQIEALEKVLEARQLARNARQRGFELGTVTTVDVLDAVRDEFLAERDLQAMRYEHIKTGLYLRRDSGTLTADDLLDISVSLQPPEQP